MEDGKASARIKEIQDKYGVETVSELEDKITSGDVEEHNAWEELIEWKNLEE